MCNHTVGCSRNYKVWTVLYKDMVLEMSSALAVRKVDARRLKDEYDILAPSVRTMARKLSGGNLQKVILAREISSEPKMMVAVQPTRGLDVGAIESIQTLLLEQRQAGTAILLISEELEELLALSDRIAVIFDGRIMGVVQTDEADINEIGLMMTGSAMKEREGR